MAALSELAKCTSMLNILSGLPSATAFTVTVKGTPVVAVEGALTLRSVTGLPQLAMSTDVKMAAPTVRGDTTRIA